MMGLVEYRSDTKPILLLIKHRLITVPQVFDGDIHICDFAAAAAYIGHGVERRLGASVPHTYGMADADRLPPICAGM